MPPPRRSLPRLRPQDLLGCVGPPTRSAPSTPRLLVAPAPPLFSLRGSLALLVLKPPPPALAASLLSSPRLSHSALWPYTASCFIWSLPIPLPHAQLLLVSPPSSLPPARGPLLTLPAPRSHPPPHSLPAVSALASFFLNPYAPLCLGLWPSATSPPERVYHRPHSPFFPPLSSHSDLENK